MKRMIAAAALSLALSVQGTAFAADAPSNVLNVSYDVARELLSQVNQLFNKDWEAKTQKKVEIRQSHGGSSSQARSVLEGLQADIVTFNQVTDVQVLHDKGNLIPANWQSRLPNDSSPFYSLPTFVVRKGNPKNIKDWDDLVKDGVQVVFPNPKTSGNGRYTYLGATAYALSKFGGDKAKARDFAKKLFANVPVFDTGGRAATTTFVNRGIGDVLVTFESEAYGIRKEAGEGKVDVVTPSVSFLAEFPVTVVDKVVDARNSRALATAYLEFLYTPAGQDVIAKNYYRVRNATVAQKYAAQFPQVTLVTAKDFGGWDTIAKEHFADGAIVDQIYVNK